MTTGVQTRTLTVIEAVREALREEMERDDRVVVLGEDVGQLGGVFRATDGLLAQFGPQRVIDTPMMELGIAGLAVGMAMRRSEERRVGKEGRSRGSAQDENKK